MNATAVAPVTLSNEYVTLEPLAAGHAAELEAAAVDGELWNFPYTRIPGQGEGAAYVDAALKGQAEGRMLPFAVREASTGKVVGSTRYYDIDLGLPRLYIGYTWYAKAWQQKHLNTACKQLLLEHAFDSLHCVAVAFNVDEMNGRSMHAVEHIGAQREGVLRAHKRRRDGSLRNTVAFSILAEDWPNVENWLAMRLNKLAP